MFFEPDQFPCSKGFEKETSIFMIYLFFQGMLFRFLTFYVICHVTKLTFEQPRLVKTTMATKTDLRVFVVGYTGQVGRCDGIYG